nr:RIP metalloprotease RseP [Tidjanibacter sp.]
MDILIKVLQFILSFSLLVIIHELGHFLFARIFGVRVEQFQLFFGRPIASFTRRGTRYGIGWIPFGGYVKLAGMIDESMDTEQMKSEPKPDEFRSKPAWQRLLIMVGGVLMNILLALVIYIGISWKWGESYLSTRDMTYGYVFSPQGEEMGFRDGDRILSVNGETYDDFRQLRIALLLEQNYTVEVLRDGDTVTFRTPVVSVNDLAQDAGFISPRYPFLIGQVVEGSGAAEAGLRQGDRLVELNGEPLAYFDQYTERLPQLSGTVAEVGIVRDSAGTSVVRHLPVRVSDDGRIGAAVDMLAVTPIHTMDYTFWQAVPAGTKRIGEEIGSYWKQLKLVFRPQTEAYKSLGGPLSI